MLSNAAAAFAGPVVYASWSCPPTSPRTRVSMLAALNAFRSATKTATVATLGDAVGLLCVALPPRRGHPRHGPVAGGPRRTAVRAERLFLGGLRVPSEAVRLHDEPALRLELLHPVPSSWAVAAATARVARFFAARRPYSVHTSTSAPRYVPARGRGWSRGVEDGKASPGRGQRGLRIRDAETGGPITVLDHDHDRLRVGQQAVWFAASPVSARTRDGPAVPRRGRCTPTTCGAGGGSRSVP